jgi:hypothetical protein
MACVFAAAWVRSLNVMDKIAFPFGDSIVWIGSRYSYVVWYQYGAAPEFVRAVKFSYESEQLDELDHVQWDWNLAGFAWLKGDEQIRMAVPYWSIVLPLTLISALCLLTKPRVATTKIASET